MLPTSVLARELVPLDESSVSSGPRNVAAENGSLNLLASQELQPADNLADNYWEDRRSSLTDQVERYSLELRELEELQRAEIAYESYLSERVTSRRQIGRYARPRYRNRVASVWIPRHRGISTEVMAVLALMEDERFDFRLQQMNQEIQKLRERFRLSLNLFRVCPCATKRFELAGLKYDIMQLERRREDFVYEADQLMLYGVPDDYYSARARLRRRSVDSGSKSKPHIDTSASKSSKRPPHPNRPLTVDKRVVGARRRATIARRHDNRRRTPQRLVFRILNSISKAVIRWSLAFKK
jgi:hypothetical protein